MNQASAFVPRAWQLLALSSETPALLDSVTGALRAHLHAHPEQPLAAVARALTDLPAQPQRRVLVCKSREDALDALAGAKGLLTGSTHEGERRIAFLLPGLGEQYEGMAAGLYRTEPVFRQHVDDCADLLRPLLDIDLRTVIGLNSSGVVIGTSPASQKLDLRRMLGRGAANRPQHRSPLQHTQLVQPAVFVIEYALAQLWISWGIRPDAMFGYSIGEYVAACLADVISLPDALRLVAQRGGLVQRLPEGAMLAVPLPERECEKMLGRGLWLAAINGDDLCVVAGEPKAIDQLHAELAKSQHSAIRVQTTHAFHTPMMEPATAELESLLGTFTLRAPRIPYLSNVTGTWITEQQARDPVYWTAHLCKPVRCADGLRTLWQEPARLLLEVGPGRSLGSMALQLAPDDGRDPVVLSSLRAGYEAMDDDALLLGSLGRLWLMGASVAWREVHGVGPDGADSIAPRLQLSPSTTDPLGIVPVPSLVSSQNAPASPDGAASVGERRGWRQRPQLFTTYVAPSSELERSLAELWQNALRMETVGIHDNFFDLGGHSLLAISIINQLTNQGGEPVPLKIFFEHPTLAQLAAALAAAGDQPPIAPDSSTEHAVQAHHTRCTLPNGLEIAHQNKAETEHFYEDIFEHRTYVRHLSRWPKGACVFDVGANIGLFSLFVHTLDPAAKIYAFEPSPPTLELLKANLDRHQVDAKVFAMGLSDEEKTADFTFYPFSSGMSSVYGNREEEESVLRGIIRNQLQGGDAELEEVMAHSEELIHQRLHSQRFTCQLRTLSSIIRDEKIERIDLLKIDVQKSELDVLLGIEPQDWPKIGSIAMEVHELEGRIERATGLLEEHGYQVELEQDELYRGTGIHLMYATRSKFAARREPTS